jgi:hypothetical protein
MTQVGDVIDGAAVLGVRKCGAQTFALFSFEGGWVELADAPPPEAPAPEAPAPETPAREPAAPDPTPAA